MNPPDLKHGMNPNLKLNFYHPERGFMAGKGEPENWKPRVTLVLLIPPNSTIFTGNRNRNARSLWFSPIPSRGTIRLENLGS